MSPVEKQTKTVKLLKKYCVNCKDVFKELLNNLSKSVVVQSTTLWPNRRQTSGLRKSRITDWPKCYCWFYFFPMVLCSVGLRLFSSLWYLYGRWAPRRRCTLFLSSFFSLLPNHFVAFSCHAWRRGLSKITNGFPLTLWVMRIIAVHVGGKGQGVERWCSVASALLFGVTDWTGVQWNRASAV